MESFLRRVNLLPGIIFVKNNKAKKCTISPDGIYNKYITSLSKKTSRKYRLRVENVKKCEKPAH